ncbi:23S rRNA pseudouridine(2605) synthase RluB [Photobacterium sp. GB-27]|uniref:23S rRNA pseudouridine(2605) synthase RluB n=1 Tax=unclassified Photobacterium TaxID=2628852 RepID=UPI000D165141|nr:MULTISPECIES: 23S rRNA pseudouridine(2605) synthase RluB [unclassified Photobacterium]PSV28974.1 23S rRNA pseudouridine(2605) synthase RluB [Photobacterium sp. GB-56]PSV33171.1 23S rRNA pseudouridine(2605) synthase RluB [Photobacterium sp. GB-72]PSV39565.1 23S rRNA pseudouridine(2605) synthase RluB [Photobacterium sp. GB-27]PSV40868.1 23S rRNA pseudouridine(2605) synthase RluB [Photobacterium sp. GB-210]PSV58961.1 23S rRNA pseudouridine(2605) synthase RluB [Photobacterium sp. GB-3]
MSEKLQKVLARAGQGSRREIELMIQNGRVSVDGVVAKLGDRLEDLSVSVRIDGHNIELISSDEEICRILAYNKPEGELCTRHDPEGRRTVFDRLPRLNTGRWVSVGRLDANTSGLLLFTTDGELANRLMHPSRTVEREYMVRVFGEVTEQMVKNVVKGVELEDGLARFEDVVYAGGEGMNHTFYVVITEGRNREVRRLWDSQGVTVSRLKRVRYGDVYLTKDMPRGGWSELELKEVNELRATVELPPETETALTVEGQKRKKGIRQIRRAVRRHEERVETGGARGRRGRGNDRRNPGSSRNAEVEAQSNEHRGNGRSQPAKGRDNRDSRDNGKPQSAGRPQTSGKPQSSGKRKPSGNAANRRNPLANKPAKPRTRK